jgi:predicted GH43/DUF377 family glycosyl hydrolase
VKTYLFFLAVSLATSGFSIGQEETGPDYFDPNFPEGVEFANPLESPDHLIPSDYDPSLIDLEERSQDFVLETKRIHIQGHPYAFNPSIIRWKGSLLLSFRTYSVKNGSTHQIGLVWLDDSFNPVGEPKLLEAPPDSYCLSKRQDPRLIQVGESLYMIYNNQLRIPEEREIRRLFVAEVFYDGFRFYTDHSICLTHFDNQHEMRTEKNWVPFNYQEELRLSYSLSPHIVLKPDLLQGSCETISQAWTPKIWNWGTLRGGTPALLENGEYLAFFHSSINLPTEHSNGKVIIHYFMGAYTFSAEPPFTITKISSSPIISPGFYKGASYKTWRPLRVVFPMGFISDERYIWLSYGRQDHEVWIAKLDKKKLFESLIPLNP